MKELRKRVNGLIAILLAVCLSLEMSGSDVYAATYEFGEDASRYFTVGTIKDKVLLPGDIINGSNSGGFFDVNFTTDGNGVNAEKLYDLENFTYYGSTHGAKLTVKSVTDGFPIDTYDGLYVADAYATSEMFYGFTVKHIELSGFRYPRYNLSFDANKGTTTDTLPTITDCKFGSGETIEFNFDSLPARQGYSFAGWSFLSDGSGHVYTETLTLPNEYENITTVNDGDTLTLYAAWNPYSYIAYFNAGIVGNQSPNGDEMPVVESTSNQPITLPECTYTLSNYHFAGWKYNGASNDGIADPTDENVGTVYPAGSKFEYLPGNDNDTIQFEAQWDPNTVSISYDANGGTGTMAGATYTYDGSIFAYLLPGADGSLSKDGYRFIGWCENADGSSKIMSEGDQYSLDFSKGNQDITLYAIWEPNAYSIRFNGNGGTGEMANQAGISSEPTILNPNQFTSIDQMFAGWSTTGTGTVQYADRASFDYKASTNNQVVDLFAIWTKLYKLAFDANGGGGNMDTLLNGMDGIGQTLPECAFTKEGFVFKGWATNPYTLTAEYQPGDSFTYSPQTAGETVTLYAIWEAEGANAADRIQVGVGTVYLTAGQEYFFGEDGVYKVDGDPTAYPMNTIFYVPVSGNYTISVQ